MLFSLVIPAVDGDIANIKMSTTSKCKCLCPQMAVLINSGCEDSTAVALSCCFCCLYTQCCWKPIYDAETYESVAVRTQPDRGRQPRLILPPYYVLSDAGRESDRGWLLRFPARGRHGAVKECITPICSRVSGPRIL